ncbi:mechanosensitive ion channel family protein [Rhodovibrionaceae bacterium A322]
MSGGSGSESVEGVGVNPGQLTPDERADLLARLGDDQVRNLLLLYLAQQDALKEQEAEDAAALDQMTAAVDTIRGNMERVVSVWPSIPEEIGKAWSVLFDHTGFFAILLGVGAMVIGGALLEFLYRRSTRETRERLESNTVESQSLGQSLLRFFLDGFGLVIFIGGALAVFFLLYQGYEPTRQFVMTFLSYILVVRGLALMSRFFLAPNAPGLRLTDVSDHLAKEIHRNFLILTIVTGGLFFANSLMHLYGLDQIVFRLNALIVSLVTTLLVCGMIWRLRVEVGDAIRGSTLAELAAAEAARAEFARNEDAEANTLEASDTPAVGGADAPEGQAAPVPAPAPTPAAMASETSEEEEPKKAVDAVTAKVSGALIGSARRFLAQSWYSLAIAYVLAVYVADVLLTFAGQRPDVGSSGGSIVVVIVSLLAVQTLDKLVIAFRGGRTKSQGGDEPDDIGTVLMRAAKILILLGGVGWFAAIWDVNVFTIASNSLGGAVLRGIIDVGIVALVAYVIWEFAKLAIDRQIRADGGDDAGGNDGDEGGTGTSRLGTLLPLLRRFIQVSILVVAIMVMLSSMGVDIGPLIAGASVIGVAIGFGAQALVKDVVSGLFFLVDDAFRVGEYVDIGDVMGTVEAINVRSLVLRHQNGPVHTIPFGEIKYLTNYSRDWVIMKLQFRVTYDTDVNKVKKIFKVIGQELLEHPELGGFFMEPFKSQGVLAMEDSAMILRGKFKAYPGKQFQLRKEIFARVQQAFQDAGIEFAHRRVAVDLPPGVDPNSEAGKAITNAAGAAVAAEDDKQAAAAPQGPNG